jgi:peptidoglycan hydrolase-like protein with peptidoglycan-binding domain
MEDKTRGWATLAVVMAFLLTFAGSASANPISSSSVQRQTVYTSVEAIREAQRVLRDRGFYNGPVNGVMNFQTRNAIRQFQRDRNLALTGELDRDTARALGIAHDSGREAVLVEINNPRAERVDRDTIRISAEAITRSGGWQVFTDHFISGDTLHVYVRGVPPRGPSTQAIDQNPVTADINGASGVTRAIFHGAQRDTTVQISRPGAGGSGGAPDGRRLSGLASRLLTGYMRDINLRGTRNQIIFDDRRNLRDSEAELLFHLYSLQAGTELFNQMASTVNDPDALRGAIESIVRQARLINRVMNRNQPRVNVSANLKDDWERFRAELARINPSYGDFDTDIDRIR